MHEACEALFVVALALLIALCYAIGKWGAAVTALEVERRMRRG